jgi:hypothetical protein
VFTWSPFLFFQHNQQYDTLLAITPCADKLKAGIAYCTLHLFILVLGAIFKLFVAFHWSLACFAFWLASCTVARI